MQDKDRDLSVYRLSLAKETLANAGMCLDNRFYRDCINRSYYAVFYSIKAILAIEGIDFKRHKDVVAYLINHMLLREYFPEKLERDSEESR